MAATTSTSCASSILNHFRANSVEPQSKVDVVPSHHQSTAAAAAHSSNSVGGGGGGGSCTGKLDGVAMWIINGVANAFFASLHRCSCIRIATVDDGEDGYNDDVDLPLILNDGNYNNNNNIQYGRRPRRRLILDKEKKNEEAVPAAIATAAFP